jgi:hypothetical protein
LFDALCDRRGHIDNATLASQLCRRQGKNARADFSAAEKSLRNWRLGRHLPLRRNFIVLSELLGVAEDPDLVHRWNRLYATARGREPPPDDEDLTAQAAIPGPSALTRPRLLWAMAAIAAVLLVAAGVRWTAADPNALLPMIGYNSRVVMAVGESRLVHGDRGDCDGGLLPDWRYTQQRVPVSRLGSFSDGGLARKMSNFCNAVVPVRAVRFTASTAGVEEVRLLDDFVRIVVIDLRGTRLE